MSKPFSKASRATIGWREHVGLPDFGIGVIDAKIDTGARTSALHTLDQEVIEDDGQRWIEFTVPMQDQTKSERIRAEIVDERDIKNSGGVSQRRFIVQTTLLIGPHRWQAELSLTNRTKMQFDMILGRTAIRAKRFLVDSEKSFLLGDPDSQ